MAKYFDGSEVRIGDVVRCSEVKGDWTIGQISQDGEIWLAGSTRWLLPADVKFIRRGTAPKPEQPAVKNGTYTCGSTPEVGDWVRCCKSGLHNVIEGELWRVSHINCNVELKLEHLEGYHYHPSFFSLASRQEQPMSDPLVDLVNHPPHYAGLSPEPVDVIEAWQLEWHEGNALKYIARAKSKGERIQDLRKAAWYLTRKADLLESPTTPAT